MKISTKTQPNAVLLQEAQQLYIENLNFRKKKFDENCSHTSISWPSSDELNFEDEKTALDTNYNNDPEVVPPLDFSDIKSDAPVNREDHRKNEEHATTGCAVKSLKMPFLLQPDFYNFGTGMHATEFGKKLTFNVKAASNVNPSAQRAKKNRVEEAIRLSTARAKQKADHILNETARTIGINENKQKFNHYISEYTSRYPLYDDHFYSVAASTTAGRTRLPNGKIATENCYALDGTKQKSIPIKSAPFLQLSTTLIFLPFNLVVVFWPQMSDMASKSITEILPTEHLAELRHLAEQIRNKRARKRNSRSRSSSRPRTSLSKEHRNDSCTRSRQRSRSPFAPRRGWHNPRERGSWGRGRRSPRTRTEFRIDSNIRIASSSNNVDILGSSSHDSDDFNFHNGQRCMPLDDRFRKLTSTGLNLLKRGLEENTKHMNEKKLPVLILSNHNLIPQATLNREARDSSIVVDSKNVKQDRESIDQSLKYSFDPQNDKFQIPRRPNEGSQSVFIRDGQSTDPSKALLRLLDKLASSSSSDRLFKDL
ncbi:hypothetical protein Ciccas_005743 [Cichlidogyrus casuarinus]|uniref:Uncharacterized protein n=1 Tax=Cichlidogyrus casuarinus TaxID=1844966 RepID=A0ABD2QBG0_9PLAT